MNKKISLIVIFAAMLAISVSACSSLDVVGKGSVTSFKEILETIPDKLTADEMNAGWALSAPDDSARFIWSEDYSRSALHDVMLEMDAQPFLDAGLDPEKLPENYAYYEGHTMGAMGRRELNPPLYLLLGVAKYCLLAKLLVK